MTTPAHPPRRRATQVLALALALALGAGPKATAQTPPPKDVAGDEALTSLNGASRAAYRRARVC